MSRRVLFYVQHLLGIGHLVRSFRIAKALAEDEFEVTIASGGMPVAGLDAGKARLVQLPPLRAADTGFSGLADAQGAPLNEAAEGARRDQLLALFDTEILDVLIVEAFPFGRRQMRFELLPLLERARAKTPRPLVLSSVRDILQESRKAGRAEESARLIEKYFDAVLVHGDENLIRFEESFPLAGKFAEKIRHTGLVAPPPGPAHERGADVIVSAGGGVVGAALIAAALQARPLTSLRGARWLILCGPNMSAESFAQFRAKADKNLRVERFAPDLHVLLRAARLSISQAGYNTAADVLQAGCAALFVPFAQNGETEQTVRARRFEARGLAAVISEAELSPEKLAAAVELALALPHGAKMPALDGAARTAEIVRGLLA